MGDRDDKCWAYEVMNDDEYKADTSEWQKSTSVSSDTLETWLKMMWKAITQELCCDNSLILFVYIIYRGLHHETKLGL